MLTVCKGLLLCEDILVNFIVLLSSVATMVYYFVKIFFLVYCFAIKCFHIGLLLCEDIFVRFIVLLSCVATKVCISVKIFLPGLLFCYQVLAQRFTTL